MRLAAAAAVLILTGGPQAYLGLPSLALHTCLHAEHGIGHMQSQAHCLLKPQHGPLWLETARSCHGYPAVRDCSPALLAKTRPRRSLCSSNRAIRYCFTRLHYSFLNGCSMTQLYKVMVSEVVTYSTKSKQHCCFLLSVATRADARCIDPCGVTGVINAVQTLCLHHLANIPEPVSAVCAGTWHV